MVLAGGDQRAGGRSSSVQAGHPPDRCDRRHPGAEQQFPRLSSNAVAINAASGDGRRSLGMFFSPRITPWRSVWRRARTISGGRNTITLPRQHVLVLTGGCRSRGQPRGHGRACHRDRPHQSPNAIGNLAVNNLIIGFNADSVAFNFVNGARRVLRWQSGVARHHRIRHRGDFNNTVGVPVQPLPGVRRTGGHDGAVLD